MASSSINNYVMAPTRRLEGRRRDSYLADLDSSTTTKILRSCENGKDGYGKPAAQGGKFKEYSSKASNMVYAFGARDKEKTDTTPSATDTATATAAASALMQARSRASPYNTPNSMSMGQILPSENFEDEAIVVEFDAEARDGLVMYENVGGFTVYDLSEEEMQLEHVKYLKALEDSKSYFASKTCKASVAGQGSDVCKGSNVCQVHNVCQGSNTCKDSE